MPAMSFDSSGVSTVVSFGYLKGGSCETRRLCKAHLRRRLSREFVKAEIAFFGRARDFVNDMIEPLS